MYILYIYILYNIFCVQCKYMYIRTLYTQLTGILAMPVVHYILLLVGFIRIYREMYNYVCIFLFLLSPYYLNAWIDA